MKKIAAIVMLLCATSGVARDAGYKLSRAEKAALATVAAASLRGNVTFLASDLLEGRSTPSPGLDIAAEYIAAQFQRAGLEPAGGSGYFQVADWTPRRRATQGANDTDAAETAPRKVRNVIALLRGSDSKLAETYILVTAHYDHLGLASEGSDRVFNGANDDASGVAALIELGSALAKLPNRPRRSILFIAFYGEERGLVGSRYYTDHPVVPLVRTIANINLEQLGRTDDADHPGPGNAMMTGMNYSDIGAIMAAAGSQSGIRVIHHPRNSDQFFARSDNLPFALRGVPAHTLCTSFFFPDGHGVGDHADKIDYENFANVTRAIGIGLLAIANDRAVPRWKADEPKAAPYLEAWRKLQSGE